MPELGDYLWVLFPAAIPGLVEKEGYAAGLMTSLINVFIAGLISLTLGTLYYSLYVQPNLSPDQVYFLGKQIYLKEMYTPQMIPILLLFSIIQFYVASLVIYEVAKVLAGGGTFTVQTNLLSMVEIPIVFMGNLLIFMAPARPMMDVNLAFLLSIPALLIGLYFLVLKYEIIKDVHLLSRDSAVWAIVIAGLAYSAIGFGLALAEFVLVH
jgi:hypothetical protein